jgi:hypothetical protein
MTFIVIELDEPGLHDSGYPLQVDTEDQIKKAVEALDAHDMDFADVWTSPVDDDVYAASEHPECYKNGQVLYAR